MKKIIINDALKLITNNELKKNNDKIISLTTPIKEK